MQTGDGVGVGEETVTVTVAVLPVPLALIPDTLKLVVAEGETVPLAVALLKPVLEDQV